MSASQGAVGKQDATPVPGRRDPKMLMRPERLAALQPSRLSASRALMVRAIRERWSITRVNWSIDAQSRGTALYRIETPGGLFDFPVYSFEYRSEGRTGRIIGRAWDMMGALLEGSATAAEIEETGRELPKLYRGRATPRTLVWCRSNRSSRAFNHTVDALAGGRQPDLAELAQVGYLMRNTGLDGNGTFGTRSFRALEPDHVLGRPLDAQMLCAYLMRVFAVDLVNHLARTRSPDAAELDIRLQRFVGVGNGSALGLVLFVNNHPHLIDRWLDARETAIAAAKALTGAAVEPALRRLSMLVRRAAKFRAEDRMEYEVFAPSSDIAAELLKIDDEIAARLANPAHLGAQVYPLAALCDTVEPGLHAEAFETLLSLMIELVPDVADALGETLGVDEEFVTQPAMSAAALRQILRTEYGWALDMDLRDPSARSYVWYKSENAEEPRRGPWDEVEWAFNLGLDLPRLIQELDAALTQLPAQTSIARLLLTHPEFRATVARVQTLSGLIYHSPHMNIMDEAFVPVQIVRLMNVGVHGIDKTRDFLGETCAACFSTVRRRPPISLPAPTPTGSIRRSPCYDRQGQRAQGPLLISVREARLTLDRIFLSAGVPDGLVPGVREHALVSAALGLGGLPMVFARHAEIGAPVASPMTVVGDAGDGTVRIDVAGQHAWLAGATVLDLAIDEAERHGRGAATLNNVGCAEELAVVVALARRSGVRARVTVAPAPRVIAADSAPQGKATLEVRIDETPRTRREWDPVLYRALHEGLRVETSLWWDLHHLSNRALSPDTVESRRHAGPIIVTADGQIIGRPVDDDTDVSLLRQAAH